MENEALPTLIAATLIYREYEAAARIVEGLNSSPVCLRCGVCCQENTPFAYGWEAANAVSHLIGEGRLYPMQRRIEGWLLERHSQAATYEPLVLDRMTFGLDDKLRDEALALSHTPCVFYENKTCLIHDYRPVVCRAFGVTRQTPGCPIENRVIVSTGIQHEMRKEIEQILDNVPKPTWKHAGFLPTLIYAHAWPNEYQKMVSNGLIATAKLVMTYPSMAVLWQEQVESMTKQDLFRGGQEVLQHG